MNSAKTVPLQTPLPWWQTIRGRMAIGFCSLFGLLLLAIQLIQLYGLPFDLYAGALDEVTTQQLETLSTIADSRKDLIEKWIRNRRLNANTIAQNPAIQNLAPGKGGGAISPATMGWLNTLRDDYQLAALRFMLPSGGTMLASIPRADHAPSSDEQRAIALNTGSDEQLLVTYDAGSQSTLLHIILPVRPGGDPDRAPLLLLDLEADLQEFLATQLTPHLAGLLGKTGEVVLVDSQKRFLTGTRNLQADGSTTVPLQTKYLGKAAELSVSGSEGTIVADDYRAIPVLAAYRHIQLTPEVSWGMVVKRDQQEVFAGLEHQKRVFWTIFLLGITLTIIIAVVLASRLTKPLRNIVSTARTIQDGDLTARADDASRGEVAVLAQAFNSMLNQLQAWHTELDRRVSQRTEQLVAANDDLQIQIAERQMAEEELLESKNKISQLLQATDQGIYGIDTDGKCTFINRAGLNYLGYQLEECIGTNMHDLIHHSHPDGSSYAVEDCPLFSAKKTGVSCRVDSELFWRKDGTSFACEYSSHPIFENGRIRGAVVTFSDITYRKRAEEERAKLEAQLQQAQKMESVGRLAGGVAHDFNNMLGVILGHAELALLRMDSSNPFHANLMEIRGAAERSAALTSQLLAFARKQTISPQAMNLNETVAGMLKMLQRLIGEDINLTWRPAPELWQVKADPGQIDQILANLCVNARDVIDNTGRVTIETRNSTIDAYYCEHHPDALPGEYVQLSVSDNGSGMEKEVLDNIFEPFYTTKELGKGTGLGLATVFGIVKQNNGFINVYSEPGEGTTFSIYFPRLEERGVQPQAASTVMSIPGGQEAILLVEDEAAILELAAMMLEKLGYAVLKAHSPADALVVAREHVGEIDLLMTDVIMPGMNGRDLAKQLLSSYPGMKCLFMSGYTADVIAHHGVLDEDVHFIQKPFSLTAMAAKVREVLDSNPGGSARFTSTPANRNP
ncbi:MAG: ATP-binding protein [Desulfuromonadaceae bacterium]